MGRLVVYQVYLILVAMVLIELGFLLTATQSIKNKVFTIIANPKLMTCFLYGF